MRFNRASGILLHPTSLPGDFGIGDLGDRAYEFVNLLAAAGQTYWQILPLGPTGYGDSPYSSYSAFAGNTLLISPEKLVSDGLVGIDVIEAKPDFPIDKVDYGMVIEWKAWMLSRSFESFQSGAGEPIRDEFDAFDRENEWWLDDYAIFRAVKASQGNSPWYDWAAPLRSRDADALDTVRSQLAREIRAEKFCQFLFFRQWRDLKQHAEDSGVRIIGDIPIFAALDSADVWCNQELFKLQPDGSPTVVAGVPPDYFSNTGQRWGNPIYDWDAMRGNDFGWWSARVAFALQLVDIVRLDHFIGFIQNWEVPGGDETAENGQWAEVPGRGLFESLTRRLGTLPVIAEDLGSLTPEVEALRDHFNFAGMRILQYGFGGDPRDSHLPHNYVNNCVAYTGTHDNNTTVGWYRSAPKDQRALCRKYLNSNGRQPHWELIRAAFASVADTAIVPMQDVLGLGADTRMNTPATAGNNWKWRLGPDDLSDERMERLKEITAMYGRSNDIGDTAGGQP